jgi:pyridoxamine 5'-phosphate oxidase
MVGLSEHLTCINPKATQDMEKRTGIFDGSDPFGLARRWMGAAEDGELNDPNAMALSTVDSAGMPNARIVLLKSIEDDAFVFYTNYESKKAQEAFGSGKAAFVIHWKSLRRQIRCRGVVEREDGPLADEYFMSRSPLSRVGAAASEQSKVLASRAVLMDRVADLKALHGAEMTRPAFWGGIRIRPVELEFWADGEARLHDRFRWTRAAQNADWKIDRLYP